MDLPWRDLTSDDQSYILYGSTRGRRKRPRGYKGVIPELEIALDEAAKAADRSFLKEFLASSQCADCEGGRLRPESRAVRFRDRSIVEVCMMPIDRARDLLLDVTLNPGIEARIGTEVIKEIVDRLRFLQNVGLQYMNLNRRADTLSGGEAQRIRLASQLGSELSGILYVLDEPSIGLHQRDNQQLLDTPPSAGRCATRSASRPSRRR